MVPAGLKQQKEVETLPADFNDWDSRSLPSTLPADFEDFDASSAQSPRGATEDVWRAPKEPAAKQSEAPSIEPHADKASISASAAPLETRTGKARHWKTTVWVGSAFLLVSLTAAGITILRSRHNAFKAGGVTPVISVQIPASEQGSEVKPQAGIPLTQDLAPANDTPNKPADSTQQGNAPSSIHVDSTAMTEQLNAPARIQKGATGAHDADATPKDFTAEDMRALTPGVYGATQSFSHHAPQVTQEVASGPVRIPSAQAMSMVLQRHAPVYPPIAIHMRVTGVVTLRIRVSVNGSVVSVVPISGPKMLYAAATDSIRSWKFRPFVIAQRPVDFVTDLNVNFQLN